MLIWGGWPNKGLNSYVTLGWAGCGVSLGGRLNNVYPDVPRYLTYNTVRVLYKSLIILAYAKIRGFY